MSLLELNETLRIAELSRTTVCVNCGHTSYHCPSSGCNAPDCDCDEFSCPRPLNWSAT
jgi:ribosomal protein L37E